MYWDAYYEYHNNCPINIYTLSPIDWIKMKCKTKLKQKWMMEYSGLRYTK